MKKNVLLIAMIAISFVIKGQDETVNGNLQVNGRINGGFGAYTTGGVLDWNDITNTKSGNGYTLLRANATNGFGDSAYYHPFNFEYSSKNGNGNITQLAIPYSASIGKGIWMRGRYSNSWTSWVKILSENFQGNVGIGTTNPQSRLHIFQSGPSGLRFERSGHDKYELKVAGSKGLYITNLTDNREEMTFAGNGNIGIGTTSPVTTLHVKGNSLGQFANDESLLVNIEGTLGNLSKLQIMNRRSGNGSNWEKTSLRLQRVIDNVPQAYIDFGIENNSYDYGLAFGTGSNPQTRMIIDNSGNIGIGTTNPGSWKLAVNGNIRAKEVKVETGWSDFVFENDYKLPTLKEVENYINEKGHLKDIPSAKEVEKNGIFLGEMDSKLLQKIEELTLYTIQQEKKIQSLEKMKVEIKEIKKQNKELKLILEKINKHILTKSSK